MNANLQVLIVALALLWSLGFMLRRQFPMLSRRVQHGLADGCRKHGWMTLAAWLHPAEKAAPGCDNGCSSCSPSCAADKAGAVAEKPVQWRQPPPSGGCH